MLPRIAHGRRLALRVGALKCPTQRVRLRAAFTLVELLVVIAIIGVLIALLLPAVQAAREAGRRTQCKNNLRQIALGFHTFIDTYKCFPSGGYNYDSTIAYLNGKPAPIPRQTVGWTFQVLPFIEQRDLYNSGKTDAEIAQQALPGYTCPSRRAQGGKLSNGRALTDYAAAIPGIRVDPPHINSFWNGGDHNGIVVRALPIPHNTITDGQVFDGTTNTIMLGEKWSHPNYYFTGDCPESGIGWLTGWSPSIIRMTTWPPAQDSKGPFPNYSGLSEFKQAYMFGSTHPVVLQAAMGDASVRSFRYAIDRDAWWYLGQRNDGIHQSDL
jgi:prepilin-type N-terminal cleavage/methylation domain-containing protein